MECPACGSDESIDIESLISVRLSVSGTDPDDARCGDHIWDKDSPASCECGLSATAGAFTIDEGRPWLRYVHGLAPDILMELVTPERVVLGYVGTATGRLRESVSGNAITEHVMAYRIAIDQPLIGEK